MPPVSLRLAIPKGRMQDNVVALLRDAGVDIRAAERDYRPRVSLPGVEAKVLKPQNIIGMLVAGARDIGFAGADWVAELEADLVEVLNTNLDPVRLVAAAPANLLEAGRLPNRPLVIASEYARLTQRWIEENDLNARLLRTWGATEVFPPEDADCIVDNCASGATLRANDLHIVDELLTSSTRLYANPRALEDPARRETIENLAMLLDSVLQARRRVLIEFNVPADKLEAVIELLPCMREPTVSPLHGAGWCAVKTAAPREQLARVIPQIRARGGADIIVTQPGQIVP
ncbi:MAG: ATP phosphoribosyltransferase [Planctomycetota bacterium]|nr:ATP phosphoribosyltransferase [Planctomycetota bacterium]